jgi:hypothetical protein
MGRLMRARARLRLCAACVGACPWRQCQDAAGPGSLAGSLDSSVLQLLLVHCALS